VLLQLDLAQRGVVLRLGQTAAARALHTQWSGLLLPQPTRFLPVLRVSRWACGNAGAAMCAHCRHLCQDAFRDVIW